VPLPTVAAAGAAGRPFASAGGVRGRLLSLRLRQLPDAAVRGPGAVPRPRTGDEPALAGNGGGGGGGGGGGSGGGGGD
jgi:hypothetical protein